MAATNHDSFCKWVTRFNESFVIGQLLYQVYLPVCTSNKHSVQLDFHSGKLIASSWYWSSYYGVLDGKLLPGTLVELSR